jgi:hypothetical protein
MAQSFILNGKRRRHALMVTLVVLAIVTGVVSAEADMFALTIEFVKSTFPQLRDQQGLSLRAIVDAVYDPTRVGVISLLVEPHAHYAYRDKQDNAECQ